MTDQPEPSPDAQQPPALEHRDGARPANTQRGDRPPGRSKKGSESRGKSRYTFDDGLERCFCRNATRVPPRAFPVFGRDGVAKPSLVVLAKTDRVILLCDLLHEGPHLWPDGELVTPD